MTLPKWMLACAIAATVLVPVAGGAATLDQETFDACAGVDALHGTSPARREVRAAGKALARLESRAARKRLAPALLGASSAKERTRAVADAYRWCADEADAYRPTDLVMGVPDVVDVVDTDTVTISGTTAPGATVTVSVPVLGGSRDATTTADANGAFTALVAAVPLGEWTATVEAVAPLHRPSQVTLTVRRTESEAAYKASTREVPPDELKKDPAGLRGTRIYSRGEVFQYDSRTGLTAMLVSVRVVNPGRFEFWTDPVLVRLESEALGSGIDEDDIVELWGEIQGAYSYGTAIGGTNTVPEVLARYVNLLEKK